MGQGDTECWSDDDESQSTNCVKAGATQTKFNQAWSTNVKDCKHKTPPYQSTVAVCWRLLFTVASLFLKSEVRLRLDPFSGEGHWFWQLFRRFLAVQLPRVACSEYGAALVRSLFFSSGKFHVFSVVLKKYTIGLIVSFFKCCGSTFGRRSKGRLCFKVQSCLTEATFAGLTAWSPLHYEDRTK